MKRNLAIILTGMVVLAGCRSGVNTAPTAAQPTTRQAQIGTTKPPTSPVSSKTTQSPKAEPVAPAGVEVVARVDGQPITMDQLQKPLIDAYGLNVLMQVMQLELARREAAKVGVVVSAQDVQQELELTQNKLFGENIQRLKDEANEAAAKGNAEKAASLHEQIRKDNEQLLEQFLTRQRISRAEFDLVIQTNTHLRKMAQPLLKGKITEANLREAFGVLYGENVKVRHIQVANLQEVAEVRRRLEAGESFEKVAMLLSRDKQTAALGGELPLFSRNTPTMPAAFKDVAFSLKEGEVSEPVQTGESYHLIKLERKVAPKAVKFEDVKAAVEKELYDRWLQATVNQLRQELAQKALATMQIEQPVLKRQFEEKLRQQNAAMKNPEQVRREMDQERQQPATRPTAHPPATRSGAVPDQAR